jgi:hypothetical protein
VVIGSAVRVEKTSDLSEILSTTAAAALVITAYEFTTNVDITVVVRKSSAAVKYLPATYTGTITSNGFSLAVNQIADTIVT